MQHFDDLEREEQVMVQLYQVIDPELGIDLVNLGLIYNVEVEDGHVIITMTYTTPECPLREVLEYEINRYVKAISWVETVEIKVTFTPQWSMDRISRYARIALGI